MVRRETIERICLEVADWPEPMVEREFDRFFAEQETVCDFLVDSLEASSQLARELALYLSYVAYKGMTMDSGLSAEVDTATLVRAGESARAWLDRMGEYDWTAGGTPATEEGGDEPPRPAGPVAESDPMDGEPHLLGFVAAEIEDSGAEDRTLDENERGKLMFTLKTVIAAMTETTSSTMSSGGPGAPGGPAATFSGGKTPPEKDPRP